MSARALSSNPGTTHRYGEMPTQDRALLSHLTCAGGDTQLQAYVSCMVQSCKAALCQLRRRKRIGEAPGVKAMLDCLTWSFSHCARFLINPAPSPMNVLCIKVSQTTWGRRKMGKKRIGAEAQRHEEMRVYGIKEDNGEEKNWS